MWLGRLLGVDIRASGSGNIGATNVARALGVRPGVVTLVADVAKGAVPVLAAGAAGVRPVWLSLVGVTAVVGHILPLFARFKGGKGVATAAGAFLVVSPLAVAGAAAVFVVTVLSLRVVSIASLSAGMAMPVLLAVLGDRGPRLWAASVIAVIFFVTHRDNLRRLAAGTEPRFRAR